MFFLSDPESNYGMIESWDPYETYGPWVLSILASFLHQYYVKAPLIERRISMRQNAVICAEFWPNGRIKSFGLIKHGKWHGPVQGFWDNGELDYRQNFNEGITDGPYEFFFPNGRLEEIGSFDRGHNSGVTESFATDGKLRKRSVHKSGGLQGLWPIKHEAATLIDSGTSFEMVYDLDSLESMDKAWH